jgi:hypothetical protein
MTNLIALPNGTELVGDYRIDRVLGAGGFGITYLADEVALARAVTIKEYFPSDFAARNASHEAVPRSQDCSGDYRWGLDRFIEEAQTLARFDHPNIVRVYRYFRANNTGYMVLHFEEGQSLKNWLKGLNRAPRQKELDALVAPLLEALEMVHKADFLHRDIAPDNVIIRKNGAPVLIDFGSARGEIAAHSKTVSALVKPGYSPYEQYAETSRQQGPWTDIYALAATLYHAVTGKRPPDAPSRMVHDELVPAREAALSSYRPGFLKAIDRALSLDIKDRPQSIPIWRGELLAPEPQRQGGGWLTRALDKRRDDDGAQPQKAAGAAKAAKDGAPPAPHEHVPPPPDVPVGNGGLLDFMDKLQGTRAAPGGERGAEPAAGLAQAATPRSGLAADAAVKTRPRVEADAGPARDSAKAATAKDAKGKAREDAAATPPPAAGRGAGKSRQQQAVAALPAKVPARADKPRPIKSATRRHVPPLLIKLTIGAAVAAAAVFIQNRLPQLDMPALQRPAARHAPTPAAPVRTATPAPSPGTATATGSITQTAPVQPAAPAPSPQLAVIEAHSGGVSRIAFASGGTRLVSTGADATMKVWNPDQRAPVRTVALDGAATSLTVSGDDALTGHADGRIGLWDTSTARRKGSFQRNEASVWALAFTGEAGRFAAAAHDWKIALWDAAQPAQPLHVLDGHDSAVLALAYTPAATLLASGGADRTVKLWDLTRLEMLRTYRGSTDFITAVALSPDGKSLAAASLDGTIRVWSTSSSRQKRRYSGHKGAVTSLAFSADGERLVSGGADGTVRLWDIDRRRAIRAFAGHRGKVEAVAFAPDGHRIASGGEDGSIRLWSADTATASLGEGD